MINPRMIYQTEELSVFLNHSVFGLCC